MASTEGGSLNAETGALCRTFGADGFVDLKAQMPTWRERHPGVESMEVAVMGCVVNGPGESKHANLGISLPGTFEEPVAPVFQDGALLTTLRGDGIVEEFKGILERYVQEHYPSR